MVHRFFFFIVKRRKTAVKFFRPFAEKLDNGCQLWQFEAAERLFYNRYENGRIEKQLKHMMIVATEEPDEHRLRFY